MDASSTFSEQRELSQSPSPPLPDRDSPPLTTALETLIDLHREKEVQKRKREEMWVEHKRKRYVHDPDVDQEAHPGLEFQVDVLLYSVDMKTGKDKGRRTNVSAKKISVTDRKTRGRDSIRRR
jgi:hypothetical protein